MGKYNNHTKIIASGLDPSPRHGDIVEWITNKIKWKVCEKDDLRGGSALHNWDDGGWCNVNLIRRGKIEVKP